MFAFPERRLGLENIDHETGRLKGGAAVWCRGADEDNRLADCHPADPVNDHSLAQRPAPHGLIGDAAERLLGDAGIMFQFQRDQIIAATHLADKAGDSAAAGILAGQRIEQIAGIEAVRLHLDHHRHRLAP